MPREDLDCFYDVLNRKGFLLSHINHHLIFGRYDACVVLSNGADTDLLVSIMTSDETLLANLFPNKKLNLKARNGS